MSDDDTKNIYILMTLLPVLFTNYMYSHMGSYIDANEGTSYIII